MKKRILVVAAHPDDEVLGCAGEISYRISKGEEVNVLTLTDGVSSRSGFKNDEKKVRLSEFERAARLLGIKKAVNLGLPDQRLDSIALLDIIQKIEIFIKEMQPNIVFTHFGGDLNLDHRRTFEATMTACRPVQGQTIEEIYCFEVSSSSEWNYPEQFQPNVYTDISNHIEKKIEAINAYESEIKQWPHPRSIEAMRILSNKRGSEVGFNWAEAFILVRGLRR